MKTAILDLIKLLLVELQQERDYPYYLTNFLTEQYQLEKCWNQFTCRQKSKREYFWKAAFPIEHFKIATIGVVLFTFPSLCATMGHSRLPGKLLLALCWWWDLGLCSVRQAGCIHRLLPQQLCSCGVQLLLFQIILSCRLPKSPITTVLSLTCSQYGYYSQNKWYLRNHVADNNWEDGVAWSIFCNCALQRNEILFCAITQSKLIQLCEFSK